MKKIGFFLVPIIMLICMTTIVPRMLTSGLNSTTIMMVAVMLVVMLTLFRPKKGANKTVDAVIAEVLDDYCADAFADNEELKAKFYAALNDFGKNMPKAAIAKLEKLAPLCSTKKDQYAVAMASAKIYFSLQKYNDTIREYNKALVIHPSAKLSIVIGDSQQRQGNLTKAKDAYEFATELEPQNLDAWSRLATVYIADGDYEAGLEQALQALELDESCSSALASAAICYGLQDNALLYKHYTTKAVNNGYSEEKIKETVKALKKRHGK